MTGPIIYSLMKDGENWRLVNFKGDEEPPPWEGNIPPGGGNGGEGYPVTKGGFNVGWMLQSGENPMIGNGEQVGRFIKTPDRVDVWFYIKPGEGMSPGVPSGAGTSRYYFFLPSAVPLPPFGVESGSARAWIAGSGQKEFTGVPAIKDSVAAGRAVVVTLGGIEWGINHPKSFSKSSHMTVHLNYPI